MKICPTGVELFHADGQTDRQADITKLSLFAVLGTPLKVKEFELTVFLNCALFFV